MDRLIRISDRLDQLITRVGEMAAWFVLALVGVTIFDVFSRRILVLGSTPIQELEWHFHTALFMLCLGYGYLKDTHIRVDLLRERFSPRTKAWIELFGCLLFLLPYAALILYFGSIFVLWSFQTSEESAVGTGLGHRWIIKSTILIGFVLVLGAGIAVLLRQLALLFGPPALRARIADRRAAASDRRNGDGK